MTTDDKYNDLHELPFFTPRIRFSTLLLLDSWQTTTDQNLNSDTYIA
jgi:hypothetical protein